MMAATLICSFYSFQPFVAAAHAFSPKKIIIIVAEETIDKIQGELLKVKEVYGKVAKIEVVKVKGSDLMGIASKTVDLIEKNEHNLVIANISGGWKLLAQGILYGCYARKDLVEKIVCNNIDDNTLVELPKIGFGLSSAKSKLLERLEKRGDKTIAEVAKELDVTRGMVYQHLKELRDLGYVDDKFYITEAGRMALL